MDAEMLISNFNKAIDKEITNKRLEIENLKSYMAFKKKNGDWHGIADAAMDIRDAESYMDGLERSKKIFIMVGVQEILDAQERHSNGYGEVRGEDSEEEGEGSEPRQ